MSEMTTEEIIKAKDEIIWRLTDKLERANRNYADIVRQNLTIGKVIKRGKDHDEMLCIIETHPSEGGVVIVVA